jgi:hypothetical protein
MSCSRSLGELVAGLAVRGVVRSCGPCVRTRSFVATARYKVLMARFGAAAVISRRLLRRV